jgi:hypothetical protein
MNKTSLSYFWWAALAGMVLAMILAPPVVRSQDTTPIRLGAAEIAFLSTMASSLSTATTNSTLVPALSLTSTAQVISAGAAVWDGYFCHNPNGATVYIQVFDHSSPTVGTTVARASLGIPAGGTGNLSGILAGFTASMRVAATTTKNGNVAPGTSVVCNFWIRQ